MKRELVLLLDLEPGSSLGDTLEEILNPTVDQGLALKRETMNLEDSRFEEQHVRGVLAGFSPDLVFVVLPASAPESVRSIVQLATAPTIAVMEGGEPEHLLELLEFGASDFISPPLTRLDILPRMWRLLAHARRREDVKSSIKQKLGLRHLVGNSAAFITQVNRIPAVAKCDATVLVLGETGTGKELFARAIHYLGPRANGPFVPVNCGAIPADLVENELFGHERGAFTGAVGSKTGLVSEADGGTLFLDEIDCLPLTAQVKLLRFLQEKEYRPLGATRTQRADLRIIAASNADFRRAVEMGKVRQDLYYRLNIVPFTLPPLRERRDDIPLLVQRFVSKYAAEFEKQLTGVAPEAMRLLLSHDWPGNVRELEHVIERAAVLAEGPTILQTDLILEQSPAEPNCGSFQEAKARIIDQFEKSYITALLLAHSGNISRAAKAAQKNRRAFFQLMRKHNIDGSAFKAQK